MIDLHTHSTVSDGTYSPRELVNTAFSRGISVLALTDHDTVDGLKEAKLAADEIVKNGNSFTFVPGIELNIQWPTGEFHLLGLGLKEKSAELSSIISFLEEERETRNKKMEHLLQNAGVDISLDEIKALFKTNTIGRPHFARLMVEKKIVKHRQEAFNIYFAKGRPCYVQRTGADLKEACRAIKASGGIPVQAHPLSMYVSWGKIEEALTEIRKSGVEGIEAWHPGIREGEARRLEKIGKELGFFITAGSDFHGEKVRKDRRLGYTAGDNIINDRFYFEELLPNLK